MEEESDIVNLLWFLNEYIDSEEYQKDIHITSLTSLLNIFDQYNRIYTVNYNNFSFTRYILVENNKILKITYQKKMIVILLLKNYSLMLVIMLLKHI